MTSVCVKIFGAGASSNSLLNLQFVIPQTINNHNNSVEIVVSPDLIATGALHSVGGPPAQLSRSVTRLPVALCLNNIS